jgi:hypothetical protein
VPSPRVRRPALLAAAVAVTVALLFTASGCGFVNALAHPEPVSDGTIDDLASASDAPTTDPQAPRVIAEGDLQRAGRAVGHLTVTAGPVRTGLIPPVPNFTPDCPVEGPSLQYVEVGITYTYLGSDAALSGLAGHLTVRTSAATPAGIGDVGVFFESQDIDEEYCAHYPPLPTTDTFYNHAGPRTVYGYVVLDRAVTPATPQGRPEVFPTLQLELSNLRFYSEPGSATALTPGVPSVGSTCAGDATTICMPLG